MEHRELEEMHEGLDQALRAALQGLGSLRERQARRAQMTADQTRVAAAADRRQFEAYQQAQDAMLREQLGNVTTDKWWDTTTPEDMARTVDLAERYADISPYAAATLDNLRSEAERRGLGAVAEDSLRRGGVANSQTPPPAYERSRASDMTGADPEHVRTRLTVANAFVHPIRTYTTGRSKTASGDADAPSRRQQLKRGK